MSNMATEVRALFESGRIKWSQCMLGYDKNNNPIGPKEFRSTPELVARACLEGACILAGYDELVTEPNEGYNYLKKLASLFYPDERRRRVSPPIWMLNDDPDTTLSDIYTYLDLLESRLENPA